MKFFLKRRGYHLSPIVRQFQPLVLYLSFSQHFLSLPWRKLSIQHISENRNLLWEVKGNLRTQRRQSNEVKKQIFQPDVSHNYSFIYLFIPNISIDLIIISIFCHFQFLGILELTYTIILLVKSSRRACSYFAYSLFPYLVLF